MEELGKAEATDTITYTDDFSELKNKKEYAKYFKHLEKVFLLFLVCLKQQSKEPNYENKIIKLFLEKFLYSIELLKLKYGYSNLNSLHIDLTESSFPNSVEISRLDADMGLIDESLSRIPTEAILLQAILDYMFQEKMEPQELLMQMSQRQYFSKLNEENTFRVFTPGKLELQSINNRRNYLYSWGCYDSKTNRPYIYIMLFEQDIESEPLEAGGETWQNFFEAIRQEGSRVPDIGIVAMSIDNLLDDIHPKVLKRIGIGPLYGRYSSDKNPITDLLEKNTEDFVLLFSTAVVIATDEKTSKGIFSKGKIRQIFFIPETNEESYANKASKIHKYILAPHHLLQEMFDDRETFAEYLKREIITYGEKEELDAERHGDN